MRIFPKNSIEGVSARIFVLTKEELMVNNLGHVATVCAGFMACGFKLFDELTPESTIFVCGEIADQLTKDQLIAIVLHEAGHVANGDVEKMADVKPGVVVLNPSMELSADAYAAKYVGKENLAAALIRVCELTGIPTNNPVIAHRIAVLRSDSKWSYVRLKSRFKLAIYLTLVRGQNSAVKVVTSM